MCVWSLQTEAMEAKKSLFTISNLKLCTGSKTLNNIYTSGSVISQLCAHWPTGCGTRAVLRTGDASRQDRAQWGSQVCMLCFFVIHMHMQHTLEAARLCPRTVPSRRVEKREEKTCDGAALTKWASV